MKISGTSVLSAERTSVWRALNDPAVLVRTIPGCRRLEALGGDAYAMTVSAGVGAITGVYDGEVRLSDQQEPGSFTMHAKGSGAPGTIAADVAVTLAHAPDGGTRLSYDAEATVGGMIGGVGQRMLTGVSRRMAEEFFRNVDAVLAGAASPAAERGERVATGHADGMPKVYTAPTPGLDPFTRPGFAVGVAVGAGAALVGALVGAWIAGRRRG